MVLRRNRDVEGGMKGREAGYEAEKIKHNAGGVCNWPAARIGLAVVIPTPVPMRPSVSLIIPQPCNESWAAMTPHAAGRHCAACQQTVVDFTRHTDAEILAHLAKAAGARTCGRFAAGQLERPLQRAAPAAPTRWRTWLAAAASVWALRETSGLAARAQGPGEQRPTAAPAAPPAEYLRTQRRPSAETAEAWTLRGVVREVLPSHEGVPGATVLLKGTVIGTSTDAEGRFELAVPAALADAGPVTVRISSIGHVSQDMAIAAGSADLTVDLMVETQMLGGAVVCQVIQPWWYPRSLYSRSRYWLTHPFRRG